MIANRIRFSLAFPEMPQPVEDVWSTIAANLRMNRCLPKKLQLSQIAGHPDDLKSEKRLILDAEGVRNTIIERQLNGFRVDTGHSSTSFGFWLNTYTDSGPQAFLNVRIEQKTKSPPVWNQLIEGLLVQWKSIGAWQWDNFYQPWQWYSDPGKYERYFGTLPPGFKSYPVDPILPSDPVRWLLDISNNPGRIRDILPGIFFVPTAEMWLGDHFWQYAKCTKEEAMAADFFLEVRDTPNFLYLKSWPQAFTRPDGEQGRQQQRIWKLFFHEDCEWPPGSGTICDEPMYGPPELMPGDQADTNT